MLKRIINLVAGDPNKREIEKFIDLVNAINVLEPDYEALSDDELHSITDNLRNRLLNGETLNDLLVEAFAAVREASKRTIGLRHYDVQLIGGIVLHRGKISEMRTGEGKTLVATLPLYLNSLTGKGVHLVTVNDYLARRDARWMAPIFSILGMNIGVLQIAARTENGKKAYLVDLDHSSPHEDQDQLRMVSRREAYAADIVYGTNSEFGFDYLRDNMTLSMEERVQRGHYFAIVDEVDNVLIDEARTPLIISGPAQDESSWYNRMSQIVRQLNPDDVDVDEKNRIVVLTEIGESHIEQITGTPLRDPDRPEDLSPDQAQVLGYLEQALRAQYLFRKNKDYLVQSGKVIIVDEFTGRLMPGRRWSEGLHQAVEAKEGVKVEAESVTYATITIQNYFRMYEKLAGMTGTALTESEEFNKIYKLDALAIPTNLEYIASREKSDLIALEGKDESGYKVQYYSHQNDLEKKPVYWKRKDYPDIVYRTEEMKLRAITQEILKYHVLGRPVLVGTTSVELSERVSTRLKTESLRRLSMVLLLRNCWLKKQNREEDGRQISELQFMYTPLDKLDLSEMRRLARELEISFNPEEPDNLVVLEQILNLNNHDRTRLIEDLQGGIRHQVLNARKHSEESQIIADAGAFGAVTIATNMAGRGVDIKLGGELAEEVLASVNRVLKKAGNTNPFDLTMKDRQDALLSLSPEEYGIYQAEVQYYLQHMDDMGKVRNLGGLHVIGSERHEARRIDNQLRGRAARQGDPGSSRFYLSMEDELMRLFGGQQADGMMKKLKIDDAMPLEANVVGRIVEQSQNRVEGANFDMRKHLLEYDDVLNNQRNRIYSQRDIVFIKEDLSEDVRDMLREEVNRRVPLSTKNKEGPWELLAWLNDIQPSFVGPNGIYPTFTLKLLIHEILNGKKNGKSNERTGPTRAEAQEGIQKIVRSSIDAEEEHLDRTLTSLLEKTADRMKEQLSERMEAIDLFFEGINNGSDGESDTRRPVELLNDLQNAARMQLRLTPEQQRQLRQGSPELRNDIQSQVMTLLFQQSSVQLSGAVERRLDEPIGLEASGIKADDWKKMENDLLESVHHIFDKRRERFLGNGTGGQIIREVQTALERSSDPVPTSDLVNILVQIPLASKSVFNKKTHQKMTLQTNRLNYFFHAANLLEGRNDEDMTGEVLEHLEGALDELHSAWGSSEWNRIANYAPRDLDANTQQLISRIIGQDNPLIAQTYPFSTFEQDQSLKITHELGRRALTEIYRHLILSVISNLWIDYLTEMESLRVSSGLEAYAQRDPLVNYKNRASSLFQQLLTNVRLGVVSRMFTYRPQKINITQAVGSRSENILPEQENLPQEKLENTDDEVGESSQSIISEQEDDLVTPEMSNRSKKRRRNRK